MKVLSTVIGLCFFLGTPILGQDNFFGVQVVDRDTGRGVPLVELRTVHQASYWTDSAGWIAINEPALEGQQVFFAVFSHGYEVPKDGFGYRGVRLTVSKGGRETIRIHRTNIAERLYRVTGADIYRDSVLLGKPTPIEQPLLNAQVLGSDSVQNAVFGGRIYWFWGDTNRAKYPLGNFHVPGATSELPTADNGLDPASGVDLKYFQGKDGFASETCRMPGPGPTWIEGLTVLGSGEQQQMMAGYVKIKDFLTAYERGIVQWNDSEKKFEKQLSFSPKTPLYPMGHSIRYSERGQDYVYFCHPLPLVRVRATLENFLNPASYESFTYFTDGSQHEDHQLDRDATGNLIWKWRPNTIRPTRELEARLVSQGQLRPDERAIVLKVADPDQTIVLHTASIAWNPVRMRWMMIGLQVGGQSSMLGEVYYCESAQPTGPWSTAVKVVSHQQYSFYNPRLHHMLTSSDGRYIYFEGTYTKMFSAAKQATPRYNYNQIMYRLDLDDPRLRPATIPKSSRR